MSISYKCIRYDTTLPSCQCVRPAWPHCPCLPVMACCSTTHRSVCCHVLIYWQSHWATPEHSAHVHHHTTSIASKLRCFILVIPSPSSQASELESILMALLPQYARNKVCANLMQTALLHKKGSVYRTVSINMRGKAPSGLCRWHFFCAVANLQDATEICHFKMQMYGNLRNLALGKGEAEAGIPPRVDCCIGTKASRGWKD